MSSRLVGPVVINLIVLVALLAAVEIGFRVVKGNDQPVVAATNGLGLHMLPYVMFTGRAGKYTQWTNELTGEKINSTIVTNSLGFNDKHEFSLTEPYEKAEDERVVLLAGGSSAWGVGQSSTTATVAGRVEHYLNAAQNKLKYTVINLGMGSWIAYQEFLALELWGKAFNPDWVVVLDGPGDASVGCAYSQGVMNTLYFPAVRAFIDGYFSSQRPVFYRGWVENQIIRFSSAYRSITGKDYIRNTMEVDSQNTDETRDNYRKIIEPTRIGQSRDIVAFYMKAQQAIFRLYPDASYILSTAPLLNSFSGDFTDVYDHMDDPVAHRAALAKRDHDLETYLTATQREFCNAKSYPPSMTYIYVKGAFELEKFVDSVKGQRSFIEYHNMGRIFPDQRAERVPYFVDPGHFSDKGADELGKFYAQRILTGDAASRPKVAAPSAPGISVKTATYGRNCGARRGNSTELVKASCDGKKACEYLLDVKVLGDAAPGCGKAFEAEYTCGSNRTRLKKDIPAEAGLGSRLVLACEPE